MSDMLISLNNPKSAVAEAYRTLRTNIEFSGIDNEIKSIAITSSEPGEGKSTVTSNLAITMARANKRVLIIDADLRKPTVHKMFGISNKIGLTNMLIQNLPLEDVIQKTAVFGLEVLPSGPIPPNSAELLGSKAMQKFMAEVKGQYGIVLVDTPPVGPFADAAVISALVDGTILVFSAGRVRMNDAQRAKQMLMNVKANILGVVLNKVPINYSGYNYYNYYYYYTADEEKGNSVRRRRRKIV